MHKEEIKAQLRMKGVTQVMLAEELEVATSSIAQAIAGRIRSARIQDRIASIIGKPVSEIWPNQVVLRRTGRHLIRNVA
jgi:lambda repressor-like predicted transcriptional regulator